MFASNGLLDDIDAALRQLNLGTIFFKGIEFGRRL